MAKDGKPQHFSMIRGFHMADFFTLGNATAGALACFLAMDFVGEGARGLLLAACAFMPLALAFDVLDGRIARWRRSSSLLGRELDSLADVISFGVAPAVIGFAAGLRTALDRVALAYFVCCGVSRLARYNVTAEALSEGSGKVTHFEGTPIPTSILLVGLVAAATFSNRLGEDLWGGAVRVGPGLLHPLVLLWALSGSLMISKTLRIPKL